MYVTGCVTNQDQHSVSRVPALESLEPLLALGLYIRGSDIERVIKTINWTLRRHWGGGSTCVFPWLRCNRVFDRVGSAQSVRARSGSGNLSMIVGRRPPTL